MPPKLILVIEDNEKNRKLVRDVLEFQGYRVLEAETAEEGLILALKERPALILMDIQLSGMDGIEALRRLRSDPETASIPVIAVTASVMQTDRARIEAEGFDGYQAKPIQVKAFVAAVAAALGQEADAT